ncbi:NAD(P)-binding domain-containing protein [Rhodohalobacter sp.]|uniref:NAD(P)-binding domain-containing protein n=1 Tax=Rhodohalobacter sp. TaxID=1974210 RepID=UPI002ACE5161|nr:NAD(P)-binding domain-containing protein [Rhodohalobacter sp.]MDZ7758285.1 NAD(P)-binding domain-containing protein [Rhodohalobacter sp.]
MKRISIIGAGSFGTAIAVVLGGKKYSVTIWAREEEIVKGINTNKINPSYLTDVKLPDSIEATRSLEVALKDSDMVVFATPSHAFREVARKC